MIQPNPGQIIFTDRARCRDCYRCLRVCPVKAIRVRGGQAFVEERLCIACGRCVRECPQGAKNYRNDIERAIETVREGGAKCAVTLAPSFAGLWPDWGRKRLPSALRKMGFAYVAETAVGAYPVALSCKEWALAHPKKANFATACPVVVNYVESYRPDLVSRLIPYASPMIAHARSLKRRLGPEWKVVFIGPCLAKKYEAQKELVNRSVDVVLTFEELKSWMEREKIDLAHCEESLFDESPDLQSRLFAMSGGLMKTASWGSEGFDVERIAVSGYEELKELFNDIEQRDRPIFVEPLFCSQGCLNGPGLPKKDAGSSITRRQALLEYTKESIPQGKRVELLPEDLQTEYRPHPIESEEIPEMKIRETLEKTGKGRPEDQLNCGACGYDSCRDKAIAVIRGLAEPEMCIPAMRRLAERRTDRIIETSPNGLVILDEHLSILSMNEAFRHFFMCSDAVLGKPISYLMDPEPFENLASGIADKVEATVSHKSYSLICHEILYALPEAKQYVGIFVDITRAQTSQKKLEEIKTQAVVQAKELLEHQTRMAEKIAQFLGESTAQGEDLVRKLLQIAGDKRVEESKTRKEG